MPGSTCPGDSSNCQSHFHDEDPIYLDADSTSANFQDDTEVGKSTVLSSDTLAQGHAVHLEVEKKADEETCQEPQACTEDVGFRRIIRNFTPSWFIITMSTGALSIMLHQIPYHAHWLTIISDIFFVLNILLFLLFSLITALRYILYPQLFGAVLRHPHQSLFLATFPVGLATIINMIVFVCVPAWGHGMVVFAWVLWWMDSVLAVVTCLHLTWVIMSNRRHDLAEMTALYLIPIVAIVMAATTGALVASVLENENHALWTLIISYVFWGIGTPLSWIILTVYFLRLSVHKPLQREVVVSLLLPIGPLGLSGFSLIALGKVARHSFAATGTIPRVANAGETFYLIGLLLGILLWGFAVVWFIVAAIMIATAYPFPFNMGWWGFIFPVGVFALLTISTGEEFEFRFFKVLACVLTGACVVMWLIIAARTIMGAASGKMFFAPCLGTDLYLKRAKVEDKNVRRV